MKNNNFGKWGWSIIFYSFICYMISSLACTDGVNLYPSAFAALRGWDANAIMTMSTIGGWIGVVGMVIFAQWTAKKGVRFVTSITVIIMGLDLMLFAKTNSFALFALSIIIANFIGGTVLLNAAPSTLINKWFPKKKNLAFGWATMGMPFTSLALLPLLQAGFAKFGPSTTYFIFGILVVVFGILTIFWVKNSPEEIGLLPDNEKPSPEDKITAANEAAAIAEAEKRWTIKNLMKDRNTWLIGIGFGLIWLTVVGIVSQMIPRLIADCGYAPMQATSMFSVAAGIGIFGSYFWGWLDLKMNTKRASIFYGIWFIISLVILILPVSTAVNWIAVIIVGIGIGGVGNLIPSLMGSCFGRYGYIYASRVISPINTIVRSCAFMLMAAILAATGMYRSCYMVLIVIAVIGTVMLLFVKMPKEAEVQ